MIEQLSVLVDQLKATSSKNAKIAILEENEWAKELLVKIYSPDLMYGVKSAKCKKRLDLDEPANRATDLQGLFDMLLNVSGHESVRVVNAFIKDFGHEDVVYSAVDKQLKCRISVSSINKAFPGLIPTFDVALAEKYIDFPDHVNTGEWFWSRKLDGVRLIVQKRGSDVTYSSREGKPFRTLEALTPHISAIEGDFVLDGEMCLVDENGDEDFQAIMKEIKRKDHTIKNPKFYVIDVLTLDEFDEMESKVVLEDRLKRQVFSSNSIVKLQQNPLADKDFYDYPDSWEGLMLRKNCGYEGKKTKNLLKVKKFDDAEYVVTDVETGTFQLVEDGREIEIITVTNVLISHKGNRVSVGSGLSLDQRKTFYIDPSKIIGKTIKVQYFGESTNKDGKVSLRFPTLKHIYNGKRDS